MSSAPTPVPESVGSAPTGAAASAPPDTPAAATEPALPSKSIKDLDWKQTQLPHAWLKLLGLAIWALGSLASSLVFLVGLIIEIRKNSPGAGLIVIPLLFIGIIFLVGLGFFAQYFAKFWKFKIKGTNLICAYNSADGSCDYYFLPHGQEPDEYDLALVVPVTGWFSRPRGISKNNEWKYIQESGCWSLRSPRFLEGILTLELTDWDGNRIRLTPETIFQIISRFSGLENGLPQARWDAVLPALLKTKATLVTVMKEINRLATVHADNVTLLFEMITRLDGTKRFIQSDEAKKIRTWLVGELDKRLSPLDPRRQGYIFGEIKSPNESVA